MVCDKFCKFYYSFIIQIISDLLNKQMMIFTQFKSPIQEVSAGTIFNSKKFSDICKK